MADENLGTAEGSINIDVSGLDKAELNLRRTGGAMFEAGEKMLGAFGAAITASGDFEAEISNIKAISGESGDVIDALRDKALELGKKGPFGPIAVAEAFGELAKAGITATEIIDGAGTATINLAKAGDISVPRAAEIMANVAKTFGIQADELDGVVDLLAGAANQSTLDVDDLGVSMKYVGGVAAALNIPLEDVAVVLAQLGNAGIKGSTGGTSLRRILQELSPTTKPAIAALKELGIITEDGSNQFFDAAGNAKPLRDIIDILAKSTAGLTAEQKTQALTTIFGARASASALILTKQGADGYDEMSEAIGKVSAADVAAEKLNNLNGSIKKFKAAIESALIDEGSPFLKGLRSVVDFGTKLVKMFEELPGPVKNAIGIITALSGAVLILSGGFLLTLGTLVSAIRVAKQLGDTIGAVKQAFTAISGGFKAMSAAMAANPIFLVIAAIIALGIALYVLYRNNEDFRNFVDNLWQTIQVVWDKVLNFFRALAGWFKDVFNEVKPYLTAFIDFVKDHWEILLALFGGPIGAIISLMHHFGIGLGDVFNVIAKVVEVFVDVVKAAWRFIVRAFTDPIGLIQDAVSGLGNLLDGPFNAVRGVLQTAAGWMKQNWDIILTIFTGPIGLIILIVRRWGDDIRDAFLGIVNAIVDFFTALPGRVLSAINSVLEVVTQFIIDMPYMIGYMIGLVIGLFIRLGIDMLSALQTGLSTLISAVTEWVPKILAFFVTLFRDILTAIGTFIINMVGSARDLGTRFLAAIVEFFVLLPTRLAEFFTAAWNKTVDFVTSTVLTIQDLGQRVIASIIEFFSQIPGKFAEFFTAAWEAAVGFVTSTVNSITDMGRQVISAVVQFFSQLPGKIGQFLSETLSRIWSWVADVVASIKDMGQRAIDAGVEFFSRLPGEILRALGDLGEMLYDAGRQIIQGLINGIKNMAGAVKDAIGSVANGIKDGIGGALGINSPSKVTTGYGRGIIEGLVLGLAKERSSLTAALGKVTGAVFNMTDDVNPLQVASQFAVTSNATSAFLASSNAPQVTATGIVSAPGGGQSGASITVHNTFTGDFQVRDDRDALEISRYLADETERSLRAQGVLA